MSWLETTEAQAGTMAAWAQQQGLRYDRYGVLPKVSGLLASGHTMDERNQWAEEKLGIKVPTPHDAPPARWAENLCTGTLPGRLEGTLAHYSYRFSSDEGWHTHSYTVVLARVLDGIRVARDLEARASWGTEFTFEREYGREDKEIAVGGLTWKAPIEEDEGLVRRAVDQVPPGLHYSLREGMVVVARDGITLDREELYQLCLAAAAFADGLHRVASEFRQLLPGEPLPEPRSTPYREWTDAGADKVRWHDPPPDLDSAATGYAEVARQDPAIGRRKTRGRWIILGLFAAVGLIVAAITYAATAVAGASASVAIGTSGFLFGAIMLIGVLIALLMSGSAGGAEAHFRREAWGLAAFGREYARSRGLYLEDHDEFRRRFPMPLTGSPQRVMRGTLPGGVEGRVVLWRDRNVPERGFVNMAIVAAPPASAQPPYTATPAANGWLVVTEQVDRSGRTVARLDAVAAEAARLATAAQRR